MAKVLRLQIAVEAATRKMLHVGVNEAVAEMLKGDTNSGHVNRAGRQAWFIIEGADAEPLLPLPTLESTMAAPPVTDPPVDLAVGVVPPIVPDGVPVTDASISDVDTNPPVTDLEFDDSGDSSDSADEPL